MNDSNDDTELEAELKRIRAEKAELDEQRAGKEKGHLLRVQLEQARRELSDAKAIADAEDAHGPVFIVGETQEVEGHKVAAVRTSHGVVIVKKPNHLLYRKFQDSGEANFKEFDKLTRPCVVHPTKEQWDHILDEEPAAMSRVASAVCLLAGARIKELQGKS